MNTKRYDELQVGDVVVFHGANVRIIDIERRPYTEELYKNECTEVIHFEIEPADDEAVQMLGNYYSHGWYGGIGCLTVGYRG
jgi:ASC-1-like (ASCH) protein